MQIELVDTTTGQTKVIESDADEFWWQEGNGCCDCNREIYFGVPASDSGYCVGAKRYLIVSVNGKSEGMNQWNGAYPKSLLEKFGIS